MTCAEFQKVLPYIIDTGGDPEQQEHLRDCSACAELVSDLQYIADQAKLLVPMIEPSPRVWKEIQTSLKDEGLVRPKRARGKLLGIKAASRASPTRTLPVIALMLLSLGLASYWSRLQNKSSAMSAPRASSMTVTAKVQPAPTTSSSLPSSPLGVRKSAPATKPPCVRSTITSPMRATSPSRIPAIRTRSNTCSTPTGRRRSSTAWVSGGQSNRRSPGSPNDHSPTVLRRGQRHRNISGPCARLLPITKAVSLHRGTALDRDGRQSFRRGAHRSRAVRPGENHRHSAFGPGAGGCGAHGNRIELSTRALTNTTAEREQVDYLLEVPADGSLDVPTRTAGSRSADFWERPVSKAIPPGFPRKTSRGGECRFTP